MEKQLCRLFQIGMKYGCYVLPWRMPEVIEGPGSIKKLPEFIREKGHKNVLVVTDQSLMKLHLLDTMLEAMAQQQVSYTLYDTVTPNPTDIQVEKGVALYQKNDCEAIVAVGGGSPMDCAKAIAARIARPKKTIEQLQGLLRVMAKIPVIYAVPTTAGTGSETTIAAVITCEKNHHKASINDVSIMPYYAVLDAELTAGLPKHITAATGMDALSHAVEAYTNNKYNTALEKDLCRKAVKLIYENLYTAYENGNNLEARQNMQKAAFYAGRAFSRGCVGYVHAIGHALGGKYGTPHGVAMSALLPLVMREYGEAVHERLAELCDVCGIIAEGSEKEKAEAFIRWIEEMNEKMQNTKYPPKLETADFDQIAQWAYKEANPLYPVPVIWTKAEFKEFLQKIYNEKNKYSNNQAVMTGGKRFLLLRRFFLCAIISLLPEHIFVFRQNSTRNGLKKQKYRYHIVRIMI